MIPPELDIDQWASSLRPLVRQYGGEEGFKRGLEILHFPPNWMLTAEEAAVVITGFQQKGE